MLYCVLFSVSCETLGVVVWCGEKGRTPHALPLTPRQTDRQTTTKQDTADSHRKTGEAIFLDVGGAFVGNPSNKLYYQRNFCPVKQ